MSNDTESDPEPTATDSDGLPPVFDMAVSVPPEIYEQAKERREAFYERHPNADRSETDVEDFLIEHFDWEWRTDVTEYPSHA